MTKVIETSGALSPHPADIHSFISLLHIVLSFASSSSSSSSSALFPFLQSSSSMAMMLLTIMEFGEVQNHPELYNACLTFLVTIIKSFSSSAHDYPSSSSSSSYASLDNEGNNLQMMIKSILVYLSKRLSVCLMMMMTINQSIDQSINRSIITYC